MASPRKHYKSSAFVQPTTRINTNNPTPTRTASAPSSRKLRPNTFGGNEPSAAFPLMRIIAEQRDRYFTNARLRQTTRASTRAGYDRDWGDAIVDQQLADDPGPINIGQFHPVKRWIAVYRTEEGGIDGSHDIIVRAFRSAISVATANPTPFIIRKLHIWLAPNTVNTHFSGLLITKDDVDNGILGGQYSDIAPYGEFVKFRVKFRGEGYVSSSNDADSKVIFTIGGSAKWNGVVYALVECYD